MSSLKKSWVRQAINYVALGPDPIDMGVHFEWIDHPDGPPIELIQNKPIVAGFGGIHHPASHFILRNQKTQCYIKCSGAALGSIIGSAGHVSNAVTLTLFVDRSVKHDTIIKYNICLQIGAHNGDQNLDSNA